VSDASLVGDPDLLWPDGLSSVLALAAGRALLARREASSTTPWPRGRSRSAHRRVVDADAVAEWMVGQIPPGQFSGLVVGSPHGSAVHLALALGVPWLPASFEVLTPDVLHGHRPSAWLASGELTAHGVTTENSDVNVRQVYDPVWRGWSGAVFAYGVVRWSRLPTAYREFVAARLAPGAPVIVVRDVSRWLVVPGGGGYSFQLGSRASGLQPGEYYAGVHAVHVADGREEWFGHDLPPRQDSDGDRSVDRGFVEDLRRTGAAHGHPIRQVLYRHPDVLSAAVADLYRRWLRHFDRTGSRLIVECGRLIEPWHVLRAGFVPYWCEHPLHAAVETLQWWLAGSEPFSSIEVFAEPPGLPLPTMAQLSEWETAAAFATRRGAVDRRCARAYPLGVVPPHHATAVLRGHPYDLPCLPPIDAGEALDALANATRTDGLLIL
jgi:hypothetical protein